MIKCKVLWSFDIPVEINSLPITYATLQLFNVGWAFEENKISLKICIDLITGIRQAPLVCMCIKTRTKHVIRIIWGTIEWTAIVY